MAAGAGGATTTGCGAGGAGGAITYGTGGGGVGVTAVIVGAGGGGAGGGTSGGGTYGWILSCSTFGISILRGGGGGGGGGGLISWMIVAVIGFLITSTACLARPVISAYTTRACSSTTRVKPTRWRFGSLC